MKAMENVFRYWRYTEMKLKQTTCLSARKSKNRIIGRLWHPVSSDLSQSVMTPCR